jgi:hypothetical protein
MVLRKEVGKLLASNICSIAKRGAYTSQLRAVGAENLLVGR